jgi:eukaryotic-like serine/threonine-protein kinase
MSSPEPPPTTKIPPPRATETPGTLATGDPPTLEWRDMPKSSTGVPGDLVIDGYEILSEIGRGGMGVVFKARQVDLNRIVALKMILGGSLSGEDDIARFRTEAEAAARVQHANIVNVYEVGQAQGRCFFTMEYVEGPSLAQRLRDGVLQNREAARLTALIARAVHHAHKSGFLHRDLKPSNILLEAQGSQSLGMDIPKITDFGLAKRLDTDSSQTRTGAVMGTPSYMSPEQAAGQVHDLGPPSDVYSIGAMLYEMLTGKPPFRADNPMVTIRQVLERQPAPPRLVNAQVDRDLETICLKCLEKDARGRYPTALALAEDLERYLRGDPISARSLNVLDRLGRTLERDNYLGEFHTWGTMLLVFAGIVLAEHLVVAALTWQGPPYPRGWIVLARSLQFVAMAGVFWRHRTQTLYPTTAAERQLWGIWIGYFFGCMTASAVHHIMLKQGRPVHELGMYPYWSILTGLAFFAMGTSYWGRFYFFGVLFFGVGAMMAWQPEWSVLLYGLAWAGTLLNIGLHLHRVGKVKMVADERRLETHR